MGDWDFFDDKPEITYRPQQSSKRKIKKELPKWPKTLLIFIIVFALLGRFTEKDKHADKGNNSSLINNETEQAGQENSKESETSEFAYYCYNQLNAKDKKTYTLIYNAMFDMKTTVQIQETDKDTMSYIVNMIMADHPELFWCDGVYTYISYDNYSDFSPSYIYDTVEKKSRQKEIDHITNSFLRQLNSEMSDYDKIKSVYEYVIESTDYVTGAPDNQNIYSSIVNRKSVCAGYARMTQYFLQQLGIETLFVPGFVDGTESHAWNIVKCNGKYYQVDATFGDRENAEATQQYEQPNEMKVNYDYLCCTDSKMYADRITDASYELPICNSNDLNYYQLQGTYYEEYPENIWEQLELAVKRGDKLWQCQFANYDDYQSMLKELESGVWAGIVNDYRTSIGYNENITAWHLGSEDMYTISCWY